MPLLFHKLFCWTILIVSGIIFIDIQVDGVRRGGLSSQPKSRVPHAKSVIVSNFTSPIDALYLAAIFDPIFVMSFPHSRKVVKLSLFGACKHALGPVVFDPPDVKQSTTVAALLKENPDRIIAVFPECSTTNGRGVLPLSPSLLTVPPNIDIFPLSIRYTLPDVTTPVPGTYTRFFWCLLSRVTTYLRVRLADAIHNTSGVKTDASDPYCTDDEQAGTDGASAEAVFTTSEKKVLDHIADTLARLGRNRRVGLTLTHKAAFAKAWYAA